MKSDNRTDFIINLADIKKSDSILTVGVAHIPEIERIIETKTKSSNCIDFDLKKINHAKRYTKKTNFICGDITNPDKKMFNGFDTIIMLEVLEHIKGDSEVLENIHKMLKNEGKLIITVPNKHPLHIINPLLYTQHYRHYKMDEITTLLKKVGFSIQYKNTVESPKLIFDLYVHLFCKYLLRKSIPFGILTGKNDKTYLNNNNKENKGMDCLVVATKN
ncbi:MAG: methyltransferase domain-containing protein [Nanoarchaeota archaeon]